MGAHRIKNIDVQILGNNVIIEIKGFYIDSRYSLADIDFVKRSSSIELKILSHFEENVAFDTEPTPFKQSISIKDLKPSVYYIRIDNNNNWTKWFKIADQLVQSIDVNQFQQHKHY